MKLRFLVAITAITIGWWIDFASAETFTVAGSKNLSYLVLAAKQDKAFEAQGITLEYKPVVSGKFAMDALISKEVDFAFLVDSNITFSGFENSDLKVLTEVNTRLDDGIAYFNGRGITAPQDLKGKKIGYLPATTSHVYLWKLLRSVGLELKDVSLVTLQPQAMLPAMRGKVVDAISIWNPWRANVMVAMPAELKEFRTSQELYPSSALFVTRNDVIKERRALCKKILETFITYERKIAAAPEQYTPMFRTELNVDEVTFERMWADKKIFVGFRKALLPLLNELGTWVKESREDYKDSSMPNFSEMLNTSLLKEIDPARVDIE